MVVRMIIIDDEPWSREVVKTLTEWERLGITLAGEADDGDAGLELLRSVPVDIVIADMKMPGIDG
ncbi:MAG TPA: response regulator, partial [Clostridia bacterium]|nr:response regulator [Clostridia bacterium]